MKKLYKAPLVKVGVLQLEDVLLISLGKDVIFDAEDFGF